MSMNIADLKFVQIPENSVYKLPTNAIDKLRVLPSVPGFAHFADDFAKAMDNASVVNAPEQRWGEIIVQGESVARIYSSGFVTRLTMSHFTFDPTGSPQDIADAIVKQTGGELRRA